MTNGSRSYTSRWATGLLVCIAVAGSILGVLWNARTASKQQAGALRLVDQNMPLEISGPEEFERLLLGLRSYHYRAKRRAGSSIREFYYDTADWTLARRGYSYRFTRRLGDDGVSAYSLRMAGVETGGRPFEIASDVAGPLGETIAAGAWEQALEGRLELPSVQRLRVVLGALDIAVSELAVRGVGDVKLEHLDVRDKGRTWFELDYEEWVFSALGGDAKEVAPFRWYGIALRPGGGPPDEEFRERVHQMERVLPTFYRFRSREEPRLTRAVAALGRP